MSRRLRPALLGAALAALPIAGLAVAQTAAPTVAGPDGLSAVQKAFVADAATLRRFGLTPEKLRNILAAKDPASASATVTAMMQTIEAAKFQPAVGPQPEGQAELDPVGDMAAVPLNPAAGDFASSTVLRPPLLDDTQREPGPFSLKRYVNEADPIPTFAGAPVAIRKEDLVVGKVEVAFVGVPLSLSSGWRDAQSAPGIMRALPGFGGTDVYAGVDPLLALSIADYGNLSVDNMSAEMTAGHVRTMLAEMADAGTVPFIVGGDHSIMLPSIAAMVDHYGAGKVGVVQLDAHNDVARDEAHSISDEQALSRLIETGVVAGGNVVQIGTRGQELAGDDLEWMRKQGIRYHTMAEVETAGWQKVLDSALNEIRGGPANIFVSFDISVLDPAYASGAGRPAPNGLTMREAVPLVRRVCAETKVVGFAMLDVAPFLDLSYATAMNANYIMNACLTGIAMRKQGIGGADYHSPLTLSATSTGATTGKARRR